jgi:hypothetical protein
MSNEEIVQGIEAMQRIQQCNPPSSDRWQGASEVIRVLVGKLNGAMITPEMWGAGVTKWHRKPLRVISSANGRVIIARRTAEEARKTVETLDKTGIKHTVRETFYKGTGDGYFDVYREY